MHGKGEFYWVGGKVYIGDYVDDKKEGFGILKWSDGNHYIFRETFWRNVI